MDKHESLEYATARVHHAEGGLAFTLEMFGNYLAEREGYAAHRAMDAVRYYLMAKYGWLPRDVRSLSSEDCRFALAEDMHGWTLPPEARGLYPG